MTELENFECMTGPDFYAIPLNSFAKQCIKKARTTAILSTAFDLLECQGLPTALAKFNLNTAAPVPCLSRSNPHAVPLNALSKSSVIEAVSAAVFLSIPALHLR
jgi:hypothetical protein